MKHLMTLLALVVAVTAGAQGTAIHEYPWNPDFNNDTYVGSEDLMGLLSTYGTQFGLPPEPCDYDGTPLEELIAGISNGDIILDSMFIEYQLEDVSTYYITGCPDPVTDTLIFENSVLLTNVYNSNGEPAISGTDSYGGDHFFVPQINNQTGTYEFDILNYSLLFLGFTSDGFFGGVYATAGPTTIPFHEDWFLDENGIHFGSPWTESMWLFYANYIHILPYWHYAE